jgi:SAM-dependent MidA family methyltransferase
MTAGPDSVSIPPRPRLRAAIADAIAAAGGWLPFDRYMALALYAPGLGYYSRGDDQIGSGAAGDGSDFVTAPEMSPLFGQAFAAQVAQALQRSGTDAVWEFGAGRGTLAVQLLSALGDRVRRYHVVELSGALAARQRKALAPWGDRVVWHAALPDALDGVVVGNEVLDALPVKLIAWDGAAWRERGVTAGPAEGAMAEPEGGERGDAQPFAWAERPTTLRPPVDDAVEVPFAVGTVTEVHPQAEALVRTLADRLRRGAAFFVDYGFPAAEYYHRQRTGGTLMCHRGHRSDTDPLADPGEKDITAHVDFTGIALAGQEAGLSVLGYTSQAHFLFNCGIAALMEAASLPERIAAQRLLMEHEMGELFKVIGFSGRETPPFEAVGFARGDRTHRL